MVFMWIWELHSLNENHLVCISCLYFFVSSLYGWFIQVQVHHACVQHQILHITMHSPFSYIHQAYHVHLRIVTLYCAYMFKILCFLVVFQKYRFHFFIKCNNVSTFPSIQFFLSFSFLVFIIFFNVFYVKGIALFFFVVFFNSCKSSSPSQFNALVLFCFFFQFCFPHLHPFVKFLAMSRF